MAGSFVLSLYVFIQVLQQGGLGGGFAPQTIEGYVWIPSLLPENSIKISLLIDNLSALMLVLVSFLCLLIFIYSLGYMHEEDGKPRYYAEVSLFATGMLGTVSADNFLQLLIFWEIMGLCSYLLIGFWYSKPEDGQRPDPRGDDGQGGRLPDGASFHLPRAVVRGRSATLHRDPRHCRDRRFHDFVRRDDGRRQLRHQAGARLLDDLSARLHVPRARRGRVHHGHRSLPRGGHELRRIQRGVVSSVQPRVLQGPPVPRRGQRDPRGRDERHAGDGGPRETHARHLEGHAVRRARPRRDRAVQRILLERRDPVGHFRGRRGESRVLPALRARRRHRVPDRILRFPSVVHDVPRDVPRPRPPARITARHDRAADDPWRLHARLRPPRISDARLREPRLLRAGRGWLPARGHPAVGLRPRRGLDRRRGLGPCPRLGRVRDEAGPRGTLHCIPARRLPPSHADEAVLDRRRV